MSKMMMKNGDIFEIRVEKLDVTSNHRPDLNWKAVCRNGHLHRWKPGPHGDDQGASLPTMRYVTDGTYFCSECSDEHEYGHWECAVCGDPMAEPGYTADTCRRYAAGLKTYLINGQSVSPQEWERRLAEVKKP